MNKILLIILVAISLASCSKKELSNGQNNDIKPIDEIVETQNLDFDADKLNSTTAVENVTLGPIKTGEIKTKKVYLINKSGSKLNISFADLNAKLALPENSRWSIDPSGNSCTGKTSLSATGSSTSCSFSFRLTHIDNQDYTQSIIANVVTGVSNPEYGKIILTSLKYEAPEPTIPLSNYFSLSKTLVNFSFSETKTTATEIVYLTNITTSNQRVPAITFPPSVVGTTTCISGPGKFLTKGNSCKITITGNYDSTPGKEVINESVTFLSDILGVNSTGFDIDIAITNTNFVPEKLLTVVQSNSISNMADAVKTFRIYVTNTGNVDVNPTIVGGIPDPFLLHAKSCGTVLKPTKNCYYDLKLDTTKTTNMKGVTKVITIDGFQKYIYAGAAIQALQDSIVCHIGFESNGVACIPSLATNRTITINKKLNNVLSSVPTIGATNQMVARLINNSTASIVNKSTIVTLTDTNKVITATTTEIDSTPNLNIQYVDSNSVVLGYTYLGSKLNNGAVTSYQTTSPAIGLSIPITSTQDHVLDLIYEVNCTQASSVPSIRESGLNIANVLTYKKNAAQTKCIVDTCSPTYTKAVNELSCEAPVIPDGTITIITQVDGVNSTSPFGNNYKGALNSTSFYTVTMRDSTANSNNPMITPNYPNTFLACDNSSATCVKPIDYSAGIKSLTVSADYLGASNTLFQNEFKMLNATISGVNQSDVALTCLAGMDINNVSNCLLNDIKGNITITFNFTKKDTTITLAKKRGIDTETGFQYTLTDISTTNLGLTGLNDQLTSSIYDLSIFDSLNAEISNVGLTGLGSTVLGSVGSAELYYNYPIKVGSNYKIVSTIDIVDPKVEHVAWEVKVDSDWYSATNYSSNISIISESPTEIIINSNNVFDPIIVTQVVKPKPLLYSQHNLRITRNIGFCQIGVQSGLINQSMLENSSIQPALLASEQVLLYEGNTVNVSSVCETGYKVVSITTTREIDGLPSTITCTQGLVGDCQMLDITEDTSVNYEIQKISYPFNAIAKDENGDRIDQLPNNIVALNVITSPVELNDSFNVQYSIIDDQLISTTTECDNYASIAGGMPKHPSCATLKISDLYEPKSSTAPVGITVYNPASLGDPFVYTVDSVDSLNESSNEIVINYGPKTDTIDADLDLVSPVNNIAIIAQSNDNIEVYSKFYDKNIENKISDISVSFSKKNGSNQYIDMSSHVSFMCLGGINNIPVAGTILSVSQSTELASCINSGNGIRIVFNHTETALIDTDSDTILTDEEKDIYRSGEYQLIYNVISKNISAGIEKGNKTYTLPIKINLDNDFTPALIIEKLADQKPVLDHVYTSRPKSYNAWGSGYDYYMGSSNQRFNTSTGVQDATFNTSYLNLDPFFKMDFIEDNTTLKIKVDLTQVPITTKSYNAFVRIIDPRNNESCRPIQSITIGHDNLSFTNIGLRKNISQLTPIELDNHYVNYNFRSESPDVVLGTSVTAGGEGFTGSTRGCKLSGSGISADASNTITPLLGEKYDFIGDDDFICEDNEVCYVNNLSATGLPTGAKKIAQRTYKVRMGIRSEDHEVNFAYQIVRVEKPEAGVSLGTNAVSFNVVPRVDATMIDGEANTVPTNDSDLTWIDFKTPSNSKIKATVENLTGIDCSSGCEYSFIKYGVGRDEESSPGVFKDLLSPLVVNKGLYVNNSLLGLSNFPIYASSNESIMDMKPYSSSIESIVDNNLEILAIVKKDNATYKSLIQVASTPFVHEQSVMYAIKSEYVGANLVGMRLIYDMTRDGALAPLDGLSVADANYAELIRHKGSSTFIAGATNYPAGTLFNITGTSSSNYDFYKVANLFYNGHASNNDTYHWNFRFKQCPSATPYFYYSEVAGYSCKSQAQAIIDMWAE